MLLFERHPRRYDGGLALCAPVGGAPEQIQYAGDFRVVFDYFFPDVFPFGAAEVPPNAFQDWESIYVPAIVAAITRNPEATAQLFNVTGTALDPVDPTSAIETAISVLFYSIWGTNDLIATTGGMPYGNRSTTYAGSGDDIALNAGVERIKADRRAQNYARRSYQTTGELQRPLVSFTTHSIRSFRSSTRRTTSS